MRHCLTIVFLTCLAGSLAAQTTVVNRKLSGPMHTGVVGDVEDCLISPSGNRVLYTVSRFSEVFGSGGPRHIMVGPTNGSADPIALSPIGGPHIVSMRWTPDGSRAVFLGQRYDGRHVLSSALVDGSAAPDSIFAGPFLSDNPSLEDNVQLTGDGARVVFLLQNPRGLWSASVAGGPHVRLDGPSLASGFVRCFRTSPTGSTVVYLADQETWNAFELYAVPADGSSPAIKISHPQAPMAPSFEDFAIDPSSARVVYLSATQQLFSGPLDGSTAAIPLSPTLPPPQRVESFRVSQDGASVVYRADQNVEGQFELFLAPIDGSEPTEPLVLVPADGDVVYEQFSPDGAYVVYVAYTGGSAPELFSVRVSDGAIAHLHPGRAGSFQVAPDSSRVVFLASGGRELYSVPIDGASAAVRITPDLVSGGEIDAAFALTPDSQRVVYLADADTHDRIELYRVAIEPSGAPVATKLNGPLTPGGDVDQFQIAPSSSFGVYRADERSAGVVELFRGPQDVVLSGSLPVAVTGDVSRIAARNGRVIYVADQAIEGQSGLFGAPADGSGLAVQLSGAMVSQGDVEPDIQLSPDGSTAVYRADAEVIGRNELFSVSSDGGAPPVQLNAVLASNSSVGFFRISPDGTRVVFGQAGNLVSVPIHGGVPVTLGPSGTWDITPDSTRVLFVNGGLHVVPIDGGAPPVLLSIPGTHVPALLITPDSEWVVFKGQEGGVYRLYSASLAGDGVADLSDPLVPGGNVQLFQLSVDGERVVYLADALVDERFILRSVRVDGSPGSLTLNGPLVAGGDVHDFQVSPDGVHVLYVADEVNGTLHRVPVDGSAPATPLSDVSLFGGDLHVAPDGAHVVVERGVFGLFSLPVAGGTWTQLASDSIRFEFAADGRRVINLTESFRVWMIPIEGGPAVRLSAPTGSASSIQVDGPRVVYMGNPDDPDVVEVYSSWLSSIAEQSTPVESASVVR